jgi:glycosyltransferase involved in cell wall biosynthesis
VPFRPLADVECDTATSSSWPIGGTPQVSVHISTFRRPHFLPDLIDRLEAQTTPPADFEVVIVDNGSGDDTWSVLCDRVARTPLRMAVLRLDENRGPAGARNAATGVSRGDVLAFTDDDCLPASTWLERLLDAANGGAQVVQGRTEPDPQGGGEGPWARSIRIVGPTSLFETCNIAYRRSAFDAAGGFDEEHGVSARPGGRAFGEDVLLGAKVVAAGGSRAFADDALVHHRNLPASYGDHLRGMRELAGFPALARESKVLTDALWAQVFLTERTAAFDLAVLSGLAALVWRRPALALGAIPWVLRTWPMTRAHGGRPGVVRLAQLAVADAVGAAALLEGSLRHRRPVL